MVISHRPHCRPATLAALAPRLARARDELLADRRRARVRRGYLRTMVLKRERLLAHRELQFARACATGNGRYITARQRKLDVALRELLFFQEQLTLAERETL